MVALAERAIACKGWRWLPGMLTVDCWRVVDAYADGTVRWVSDCGQMETRTPFGGALQSCPDLTDPATLGCLLALVREAWSEPTANTAPSWKGWDVERAELEPHGASIFSLAIGATEAEALVAALECAP